MAKLLALWALSRVFLSYWWAVLMVYEWPPTLGWRRWKWRQGRVLNG